MIVVDTNIICYRWLASPHSEAADNAAVLAAGGHAEAAEQNAKMIPPNSLLPEEQALLPTPQS